MSRSEPSLKQQLLEARAKLERQVEIMAVGGIRFGYQPGLKEQLLEELQDVEDALARLGPDET
ncbi:hypothetical protein [Phenylobacterium sp.]|uniref:hypothetical protein n=1 Tax=Phenylobacterium sp. TaxID=1871053 RepID=UPI002BF8EB7B|nr:hypothetical protein [Phenylobacterium sp.]HLZ74961.1 hypothetical protein [Phenylobacterium sp.]